MQTTAHAHPLHAANSFAHPERNAARFGITPGMSVADFGAGSGAYVWPIAAALENSGNLYVIDVQRDLLRRIHNEALRRGRTVKIVWADLEQPKATRLADHSIDFVLISNVLFQVQNKSAVLKEAHRVLKKESGKLAIIDWSDSFGGLGPHKKDVLTQVAAKDLALTNRFAVEKEFPAGAHHWGLLARPVHL